MPHSHKIWRSWPERSKSVRSGRAAASSRRSWQKCRTSSRKHSIVCPRTTKNAGGPAKGLADSPPSLPRWRLPELDFVSLRIHHPAEFAVLRVVGLVEHVATFLAQCFEKSIQ